MFEFALMWTAIVLFLVLVAPIWLLAHYLIRWRTSKSLTSEDEKLLVELWEGLDRMESRIKNLERILDVESADWRQQS